jgi:predicted DsbA family dithiol-disulfide isomerase
MNNKPLIIDYYTDILCVWAWVAQRRIDELNEQLGEKIEIRHYYVDIFGDVAGKIDMQWKQKGGYAGFASHVQESVKAYEDAPVHSGIWTEIQPATSANAHLILKAIEIAYGKRRSIDTALILRNAFFVDALDIGNLDVLRDLVNANGLDHNVISSMTSDGTAMAALMSDYQESKRQNIKGSPSYVIDGGRQVLFGNVGYRVIHANIEELLKHPQDEASWC